MYVYIYIPILFQRRHTEYSSAKKFKSKHSIRKRTQKIRFESPVLPAQVQQLATVLAGVEKTNLRR